MAVQKDKVSRSRRGMRRAHDALKTITAFAEDPTTGEIHRRHHITNKGYYRGRQIVLKKNVLEEE